MNMAGKLYIVPTPVGNLNDMSPRAVEVLSMADIILAEDTRTSSKVMDHFGIHTPMISHHMHNEHKELEKVISRLEEGQTVALVSDAGTPGISDPGFLLSRECRRKGIDVETLPGPTAFVPALVSSGLSCDRFVFEGFLPLKKGRASRIASLASDERTFVVYESPVRLLRTLGELRNACGADRPAAVAREISKLHETIHKGTLAELEDFFKVNTPRGEIVIIVEGFSDVDGKKIHRNKYKTDESDSEISSDINF